MPMSCLACGGRDGRLLFTVNACPIHRCATCGLGRAEPAAFDAAAYYTADYFSGRRADGYQDYVGSESVLRPEFARSVAYLRRFLPGGRLVEVGCAYGFFLKEAAKHFDATGIELAEDAARACRAAGLSVLSAGAEDGLGKIGPADAVVMLDVIEHLPNPRAALKAASDALRPGGVVMLTTGDFNSLLARLTGAQWRLMTPPQHLWFFTRESLERLATDLGFSVERIDHPWKFVPAGLILFQLRRMLGLPPSSAPGPAFGIPVNLFDVMRVVLRKK